MNLVAIIQARMGSTRFPGKVMQTVNGTPLIELLLKRLSLSKEITKIVVATTKNKIDNSLASHVETLGYSVYRGEEHDVLKRYYDAAIKEKSDAVVRITADCPLIDSTIVDELIQKFKASNSDYASNREPATYPDGLDVEIIDFAALKKAHSEAKLRFDREHVTPFIINSSEFKKYYLTNNVDLSQYRWTVDLPVDFEVITAIFSAFAPDVGFSWRDVLKIEEKNPRIFQKNSGIQRNQGANISSGIKLWDRAKKVIPGGNMLLSKRSEMYLPGVWPTYFSKAKGCQVWDLDGRKFTDMSLMGVGTNILGYGNDEVDAAVAEVVQIGNMSTLNCPEEVYLSEKLIELHPWADMVRLARTGGEANAIAIRIARAAATKQKVAICGYHGWHDWYLAANIGGSDNLDGHLLPGLSPLGVPRELESSVFTFKYNDIEELESLINTHEIGVIKMEVLRNEQPRDDFLSKVRKLANDNEIILIFDECSSGFRQSNGGLHKVYGVEPDLAIFGKALGNGYAITAVIGKKAIMDVAQNTFISSTFWTERIGPTAALKTLDIMQQTKSWEQITREGEYVSQRWVEIAEKYQLDISLLGLPALKSFNITSKHWLKYKTYITQEMLKNDFLATNTIYFSTAHDRHQIDQYLECLDPIFGMIGNCESGGVNIDTLLEGPICHAGFKRLN